MMINQLLNIYTDYETIITRLITSLIIVIILWIVRRFILRFVGRQTDNTESLYSWRKSTEIAALFIAFILLFSVWFGESGGRYASTYFGLLSAGIAIAFQEPLVNLVGWLFIVTRRPFDVGHRVQVGDAMGDVIDIRFFQYSLLEVGNWVDADQSTGRVLRVPNRTIFNETIANYTSGTSFIWNEIAVEVTFESDWKRAKQLLTEIVGAHSLQLKDEQIAEMRRTARNANIRMSHTTPIVYTKVAASGIVLTLRYLCQPRDRRNTEEQIWEAILDVFADEQVIDFAYPTQRIFYHPHEGKTLMRDHTAVSHPHLLSTFKAPNGL